VSISIKSLQTLALPWAQQPTKTSRRVAFFSLLLLDLSPNVTGSHSALYYRVWQILLSYTPPGGQRNWRNLFWWSWWTWSWNSVPICAKLRGFLYSCLRSHCWKKKRSSLHPGSWVFQFLFLFMLLVFDFWVLALVLKISVEWQTNTQKRPGSNCVVEDMSSSTLFMTGVPNSACSPQEAELRGKKSKYLRKTPKQENKKTRKQENKKTQTQTKTKTKNH